VNDQTPKQWKGSRDREEKFNGNTVSLDLLFTQGGGLFPGNTALLLRLFATHSKKDMKSGEPYNNCVCRITRKLTCIFNSRLLSKVIDVPSFRMDESERRKGKLGRNGN
jgi:hypothetical protein